MAFECQKHTVCGWKLDDICGGAGRLNVLLVVCHCALEISWIRASETDVWLVLNGPREHMLFILVEKKIRCLNPDERSTAALIRNGLIGSIKMKMVLRSKQVLESLWKGLDWNKF